MSGVTTQLAVIIGAIVGSMVAAQVAEGLIQRGMAELDPLEREQVSRRMARLDLLWRAMTGLGVALVIIGSLRMLGVLKGGPSAPWGLYSFALGFSLLCLEKVGRSWARYGAYAAEAPQSSVRRLALTAALIVTVVELGIAGGLSYFIFTRAVSAQPVEASGEAPAGPRQQVLDPRNPPEEIKNQDGKVMIRQEAALRLLERNELYLKLLVQAGEVQQWQFEALPGQPYFDREQLRKARAKGLKTEKELRLMLGLPAEGELVHSESGSGKEAAPAQQPKPPAKKEALKE